MTVAARDLLDEAAAGALAKPVRAVLTTLGTVIGVAALVATVGIARTAGGQLLDRFDELASTEIVVRPGPQVEGDGGPGLPLRADQRILRLNGAVAAGSYASVDTGDALVRSVPIDDLLGADELALPVVAASPGLLDAVRGSIAAGRWLDPVLDERAERVALLGAGAARRLHIDRVSQQPVIFVGDEAFVVIGLLADVERHPDLLGSVIIPEGTAVELFGLRGPDEVIIEAAPGATGLISRQAPEVLSPVDPDRVRASRPAGAASARRRAAADINALFVLLSVLSLVVGALGIANVTMVSVFERTGEIGLRRALGASRRSIAGQFLLESTLLGTIGGMIGASAGVVIVVSTAAVRSWTPVLDLRLAVLAPVLGALIGLASGAYPAGRASSIEPAEALRSGIG